MKLQKLIDFNRIFKRVHFFVLVPMNINIYNNPIYLKVIQKQTKIDLIYLGFQIDVDLVVVDQVVVVVVVV